MTGRTRKAIETPKDGSKIRTCPEVPEPFRKQVILKLLNEDPREAEILRRAAKAEPNLADAETTVFEEFVRAIEVAYLVLPIQARRYNAEEVMGLVREWTEQNAIATGQLDTSHTDIKVALILAGSYGAKVGILRRLKDQLETSVVTEETVLGRRFKPERLVYDGGVNGKDDVVRDLIVRISANSTLARQLSRQLNIVLNQINELNDYEASQTNKLDVLEQQVRKAKNDAEAKQKSIMTGNLKVAKRIERNIEKELSGITDPTEKERLKSELVAARMEEAQKPDGSIGKRQHEIETLAEQITAFEIELGETPVPAGTTNLKTIPQERAKLEAEVAEKRSMLEAKRSEKETTVKEKLDAVTKHFDELKVLLDTGITELGQLKNEKETEVAEIKKAAGIAAAKLVEQAERIATDTIRRIVKFASMRVGEVDQLVIKTLAKPESAEAASTEVLAVAEAAQ